MKKLLTKFSAKQIVAAAVSAFMAVALTVTGLLLFIGSGSGPRGPLVYGNTVNPTPIGLSMVQ